MRQLPCLSENPLKPTLSVFLLSVCLYFQASAVYFQILVSQAIPFTSSRDFFQMQLSRIFTWSCRCLILCPLHGPATFFSLHSHLPLARPIFRPVSTSTASQTIQHIKQLLAATQRIQHSSAATAKPENSRKSRAPPRVRTLHSISTASSTPTPKSQFPQTRCILSAVPQYPAPNATALNAATHTDSAKCAARTTDSNKPWSRCEKRTWPSRRATLRAAGTPVIQSHIARRGTMMIRAQIAILSLDTTRTILVRMVARVLRPMAGHGCIEVGVGRKVARR